MAQSAVHVSRLILILCLLALTGCGLFDRGGGSLTVTSRARDSFEVDTGFDVGFYAQHEPNAVTVILLEGPTHNPSAAAILRTFWPPNAGQTSIDESATNATVQYVVFGPSLKERRPARYTDEVGLYDGAGFVYMDVEPGAARLDAGLWQANLQLADRSRRFTDPMGQSFLAGAISAQHDDARVQTLLKMLNHLISERLGYPRLVRTSELTFKSLYCRR